MPPNAIDVPFESVQEAHGSNGAKIPDVAISTEAKGNSAFEICQYFLNLVAHLLTGILTGIIIIFVFRNDLPLGATPLHIILCVLGYQFLMAEAILSLTSANGWTMKLRLVDKRRIHWILQILGSVLAIVGSVIKILDKDIHWNTLHGQFALVAMVFTVVCLVNGLTSLYAYELRKFLPGNLSKITHILFGVVAFAAASISLCYGLDKVSFRNWATAEVTYAVMAMTALQIVVIILNPLITCTFKTFNVLKN